MRKLVLVLTLLVAVSFAANFSSLSNSSSLSEVAPLTDANAHWQLTGTNEVGCVKDGDTVYGSNDDADLTWNGATINLTGYDGAAIYVQYTQVAADANDYCTLELNAGVGDYQFPDAASPTWVTFTVPTSISNLLVNFNWVSDAIGFDTGFKMTYFQVVGVNNGDGTYTNVFTWTGDMGITAESHNVTGMSSLGLACLSWRFTTNDAGGDYQGWAIDNVVLTEDSTDIIDNDFESSGDVWDVDIHGYTVPWERANDDDLGYGGYGFPGTGYAWICDPFDHGNADANSESFSPWVSVYGAAAVGVTFDSQFQTYASKEDGYFGYFSAGGSSEVGEDWTNLDDWTTSDSGTNIEETTWGQIKAL